MKTQYGNFIPISPRLEDLETIKKSRDEETKRVNLAIDLDICPVCGAKLIDERTEILPKPKKYLFGLITYREKYWDYRKVCPMDLAHYEKKANYTGYYP